jgi:hypothetical protein
MQLASIVTQGVNTIQIEFSEHVELTGEELTLYGTNINGLEGTGEAKLINFTTFRGIDPNTHIATWRFPELGADKYRIDVLDSVLDAAGNRLDGEWENMTSGTFDNYFDDPDQFDDPDRAEFKTGNGIAGTNDNRFQFQFSILPGDYDRDGVYGNGDYITWRQQENTNGTADGNGDGVVDAADYQIWYANWERQQELRIVAGDYNDDERVNHADYIVWRLLVGMTGGGLAADGNNDGVVNEADRLIWEANDETVGAWANGQDGAGGSASQSGGGNAPWIVNLVISGSNSLHDPYSFEDVVGSGEQLRTVPVGGADTISITFSEEVNVIASNLRLVGLRTANVPTLAEFSYDIGTMTATWRFEGWALGDQYLISLSDAVTDIEGNRLDGEWTNPLSLSTTNVAVSEFPSGDGQAGGHFNFVATLLPGDANLDGLVNSTDYYIFSSNTNYGWLFTMGDFNGDGQVTYDEDGAILYANFSLDLSGPISMVGDLNGDFAVNDIDADILGDNMGMSNPTWGDGDLNGDGSIDALDVDLFFAQWGLELTVVS